MVGGSRDRPRGGASRARRSTRRRRRRRRADVPTTRPSRGARCRAPCRWGSGVLSHNSFGVVAAVGGPSAVSASTATGVARPVAHRRRRWGRPPWGRPPRPRPQPQQERQPGHELLGADGRQHPGGVDVGHPAPGGEPGGHGLAQVGGAPGQRVAVGVGRVGQRLTDDGGRGSTGVPTDRSTRPRLRSRASCRKGTRPLLGRSERVPGEVGEPKHLTRRAPAAAGRRRSGGPWG